MDGCLKVTLVIFLGIPNMASISPEEGIENLLVYPLAYWRVGFIDNISWGGRIHVNTPQLAEKELLNMMFK